MKCQYDNFDCITKWSQRLIRCAWVPLRKNMPLNIYYSKRADTPGLLTSDHWGACIWWFGGSCYMRLTSCLLSTAARRLACQDVTSPLVLRRTGKQPRCLTACRSWHSHYEMLTHLWFIWFSLYYNKLNLCVDSRDHYSQKHSSK